MEPASRRPGFTPPQTPLTRRLLVYFASGAYNTLRKRESRNMFSDKIEPMGRHRDAKVTEPASEDGIPAEMCRTCGAPDGQHENASECISFWRDRTAKLEFRLSAALGRKAIPRFVAG